MYIIEIFQPITHENELKICSECSLWETHSEYIDVDDACAAFTELLETFPQENFRLTTRKD